MNQQNPFSAPAVDESLMSSAQAPSDSLMSIAKRTFLAWEKLRLIYVAILAFETLFLGMHLLGTFEFWATAVVGGILANLCFFLGPIAETYVTWLGFRAKWLRWFLLALGTMFTMVAALGAIVAIGFPAPN